MTATKYIIRPGAGAEPEDKPREVEVWLEYWGNNKDRPTLVVGGIPVVSVMDSGELGTWGISGADANLIGFKTSGGRVKLYNDDLDINDAVQAEREACAEIAADAGHEWLTGDAPRRLGSNIAARIRARGETEGGA